MRLVRKIINNDKSYQQQPILNKNKSKQCENLTLVYKGKVKKIHFLKIKGFYLK